MQTIFDSNPLPTAKRHQAWRDAICDIYLPVDCSAARRDDYAGFVRELRLGAVVLTDTLSAAQRVLRHSRHIARREKDCYYVGLTQNGSVEVRQGKTSMTLHTGRGGLFYANEPYELDARSEVRSFWIELPRGAFASRIESRGDPLVASFDLGQGLGRIAVEFCLALATEGTRLGANDRARLGDQIMDILSMALNSGPGREPAADPSVRHVRLRSVMRYIDEHLDDPGLSPARIAHRNGISLRYLHQLFRTVDVSACEWLRLRRLQRSFDILTSPAHAARSITDIAYSVGFSSSSHFSNVFRARFGLRPSDVRSTSVAGQIPEAMSKFPKRAAAARGGTQ